MDDLPSEPLQTSTLLAEKTPNPRGDGVFDALDPQDGGVWNLRVTPKFLERCRRVSNGELKTLAETVPHCCQSPTRIYQGIREEHEHEWLCYCAQPTHYFTEHGAKKETQDDDIFLVFVNGDRRVFGFAWEKSESPNSGIPRNLGRFHRRVYP